MISSLPIRTYSPSLSFNSQVIRSQSRRCLPVTLAISVDALSW